MENSNYISLALGFVILLCFSNCNLTGIESSQTANQEFIHFSSEEPTGLISTAKFKFYYTTYGLGSGRGMPPKLVINLEDTIMGIVTHEYNKEIEKGKEIWKDTFLTQELIINEIYIDSILSIISPYKNKYVFHSNTNIMSGSLQEFYFEYEDWCSNFKLKNSKHEVTTKITRLINRNLPKKYQIFSISDEWKNPNTLPIVKNCQKNQGQTYKDILEQEYNQLRRN